MAGLNRRGALPGPEYRVGHNGRIFISRSLRGVYHHANSLLQLFNLLSLPPPPENQHKLFFLSVPLSLTWICYLDLIR